MQRNVNRSDSLGCTFVKTTDWQKRFFQLCVITWTGKRQNAGIVKITF
uniref:Uncharacterized protein n=1 Tax=Anguilla anguilla TaxID=7936 RepID=A0A0E9TL70_ANGAN